MSHALPPSSASTGNRFRRLFVARDLFIHNGRVLKRVRLSAGAQLAMAAVTLALVAWSLFAAAAMIGNAETGRHADVASMVAVQARLDRLKADADLRAERIELRQRFMAAMLAGERDGEELAAFLPPADGHAHAAPAINAPLVAAERRQLAFADAVRDYAEARYRETAQAVQGLGLSPRRVAAMGGPYEPLPEGDSADEGDPEFRAMFQSWARLNQLERGVMSVPSVKPVDNLTFTSLYGVRSDPFRGGRAMHAGVDIPGPVGTPIYATADGIVRRAGWASGYGNLIEIGHGRAIDTRYGHLSEILVQANSRVRRGDLIGRMGSTGRSTGSHLHYEVRLDGRPVDPTPFLRSSDFVLAVQDRVAAETAQGGPADAPADD
ncbi:murein DD-endopeptidase MepM/ murein hydrolase activator NlpD [Sphingomonas jejuensis]|uniref:Murein DD-endopeptidase MepM/ murein hydrolase activator NlpD n=1 Tax=Sphingomonas jejuensis TaxID=904715 RepID=A0ABX0XH82_9SPHN|nr:M23 family metallopeptidase [Sphingomonas jejuensis]NJC32682.1 murein DD-endopeptidase MepM/ murein hydrolase activator NlpD [Sphingomonas jejuensis]